MPLKELHDANKIVSSISCILFFFQGSPNQPGEGRTIKGRLGSEAD